MVVQRHLLHGYAVHKDAAAAVEVGEHIGLFILNEKPVVDQVDGAEGIVAPEHIGVKFVHPDAGIGQLQVAVLAASQLPAGAGGEVRHLLGCADDDLAIAIGFVGDHMLRIGAALGRLDALAVQSGMDAHTGAGGGDAGGGVDGLEGRGLAAVVGIGSVSSIAVHIKGLSPGAVLLPEIEHGAIRQPGIEILVHLR